MGNEREDADAGPAERDRGGGEGCLLALEPKAAVDDADSLEAVERKEHRARPIVVGRVQAVSAAGAPQQLLEQPLVDDRPFSDDRDPVAELLDLRQNVAREQDRDALAGKAA